MRVEVILDDGKAALPGGFDGGEERLHVLGAGVLAIQDAGRQIDHRVVGHESRILSGLDGASHVLFGPRRTADAYAEQVCHTELPNALITRRWIETAAAAA